MRDFFRREFAPIGTDDEDGPVELLESGRMYRAGLRENAKAGQAADDKPEKHSNKKRADKTGTQTNVYQTDNTIDSGKATRRGARPAKAAHHGGFISVSPALIALCALAPLLGQGRLMAMTLGVLAVHEAAHIACARVLGVPIGRLRLTPLGASLELDARLITPRNEALIAAAGPIASALCVAVLCLLTGGLDAEIQGLSRMLVLAAVALVCVGVVGLESSNPGRMTRCAMPGRKSPIIFIPNPGLRFCCRLFTACWMHWVPLLIAASWRSSMRTLPMWRMS